MKTLIGLTLWLFFSCAQPAKQPPPMPGLQRVKLSTENETEREAIRRAIRPYFSFFRDCYTTEFAKDPTQQGEMVFAWEIHAGGEARSISTTPTPTSIKSESLEKCLADVLAYVRYPPPPKNVVYIVEKYLFVFKGNNGKTWTEMTF